MAADHKMTRHEMKQDDLVTFMEKARRYADKNPTQVRNAAIGAAILLVAAVAAYYMITGRASAAATLLRQGEDQFGAPVAGSGTPPNPSGPSYASPAERDRAALETFSQVVSKYGSRAEGQLARYYQGILFARLGRNEESEATFTKFIEDPSSPLLASMARAQLAQARSQRGDLEGAAKIYTELAEDKDSLYPRDWALFYLGDTLEREGKKSEASAAWRKLVAEFPNSYFAADAGRRAKAA